MHKPNCYCSPQTTWTIGDPPPKQDTEIKFVMKSYYWWVKKFWRHFREDHFPTRFKPAPKVKR